MTIPEYDEECDCDLCKSIREKGRSTKLKPVKAKSVRSQRSFQEHMQSLYGKIDSLVYAAEVACNLDCQKNDWECAGYKCPFRNDSKNEVTLKYWCNLATMREILGDHVTHADISTVELSE